MGQTQFVDALSSKELEIALKYLQTANSLERRNSANNKLVSGLDVVQKRGKSENNSDNGGDVSSTMIVGYSNDNGGTRLSDLSEEQIRALYTGNDVLGERDHMRRVAVYAQIIGKATELSAITLGHLVRAAKVHDLMDILYESLSLIHI